MDDDRSTAPPESPYPTSTVSPKTETVMGRTRAEYEALALARNGAEWMKLNRVALDREWQYMVETFGDSD